MQECPELQLLHVLRKEKSKWEAREDHLTVLLEWLQGQLASRSLCPTSFTHQCCSKDSAIAPDPYHLPPSHLQPQSHAIRIPTVRAAERGASTTTAGGGEAHNSTVVRKEIPLLQPRGQMGEEIKCEGMGLGVVQERIREGERMVMSISVEMRREVALVTRDSSLKQLCVKSVSGTMNAKAKQLLHPCGRAEEPIYASAHSSCVEQPVS